MGSKIEKCRNWEVSGACPVKTYISGFQTREALPMWLISKQTYINASSHVWAGAPDKFRTQFVAA
jgi:hypothetical protein